MKLAAGGSNGRQNEENMKKGTENGYSKYFSSSVFRKAKKKKKTHVDKKSNDEV